MVSSALLLMANSPFLVFKRCIFSFSWTAGHLHWLHWSVLFPFCPACHLVSFIGSTRVWLSPFLLFFRPAQLSVSFIGYISIYMSPVPWSPSLVVLGLGLCLCVRVSVLIFGWPLPPAFLTCVFVLSLSCVSVLCLLRARFNSSVMFDVLVYPSFKVDPFDVL